MKKPMKLVRNMDTPENRAFWRHVDKVAKEVDTWPAWMRGAYYVDKNGKWRAVPVRRKK